MLEVPFPFLNFNPTEKKEIFLLNEEEEEKILQITIKSIWLLHDSLAPMLVLGSFFTEKMVSSPLTHWWVEIQTTNGWYNAQFCKDFVLRLNKYNTKEEVSDRGKQVGNALKEKNKKVFIEKGPYRPKERTMKEVLEFMANYDGKYNLASNNCQHFGKKFYRWI